VTDQLVSCPVCLSGVDWAIQPRLGPHPGNDRSGPWRSCPCECLTFIGQTPGSRLVRSGDEWRLHVRSRNRPRTPMISVHPEASGGRFGLQMGRIRVDAGPWVRITAEEALRHAGEYVEDARAEWVASSVLES